MTPCGSVVSNIQSALNALESVQIEVDGIFGQQTVSALATFQTSNNLNVTGSVTEETWVALTRCQAPPIFDRCLQMTASFEGTGFTKVVGDFDGAGVTWGIIGFTLLGGELGAILADINARYPGIFARAFGHDATAILNISSDAVSDADKTAWADSISRGSSKYAVADPWYTYFHDLGMNPEVQAMQNDRARDQYWTTALKDAKALSMNEELDLMLTFDIAVQNGGMRSKQRLKNALDAIANLVNPTPITKREAVANVVADSVGRYKADVLSRKLTIAQGGGIIHKANYDLSDWGLANGFPAT